MLASELQVQLLMADDMATDFLNDPELVGSGVRIASTEPTSNPTILGFGLSSAIVVVNALVTGIDALLDLAKPLSRLLGKSQRRVVVSTALGQVTLEPDRALSPDDIRKLLAALAGL